MNKEKAAPKSIDDYMDQFPPEVVAILETIRFRIEEAAPGAQQTIKYGMPTFMLMGRNLVHYAAFKNHIGLYPTPSGTEEFKEEIAGYKSGKGSIQFPLDKPIPYDLIRRIVEFRVQETIEKAAANKKTK